MQIKVEVHKENNNKISKKVLSNNNILFHNNSVLSAKKYLIILPAFYIKIYIIILIDKILILKLNVM